MAGALYFVCLSVSSSHLAIAAATDRSERDSLKYVTVFFKKRLCYTVDMFTAWRRPLCLFVLAVSVAVLLSSQVAQADPVDWSITFSAPLLDLDGQPYTGPCQLRAVIWDAPIDGAALGTYDVGLVNVVDGYASTTFNFDVLMFSGERRWLEVSARCSGDLDYWLLYSRHEVATSPYAILARNAITSTVAITAATAFSVPLSAGWGIDISWPVISTLSDTIQSRVNGTCPTYEYIQSVAQDGSVLCGIDQNSGGVGNGTITGVSAGTGLSGGGITGTVTLSVTSAPTATTAHSADTVPWSGLSGGAGIAGQIPYWAGTNTLLATGILTSEIPLTDITSTWSAPIQIVTGTVNAEALRIARSTASYIKISVASGSPARTIIFAQTNDALDILNNDGNGFSTGDVWARRGLAVGGNAYIGAGLSSASVITAVAGVALQVTGGADVSGGLTVGNVTSSTASGSIWVAGNMSADSVTDRSPGVPPAYDALVDLRAVAPRLVDGSYQIDHATLPPFVRKSIIHPGYVSTRTVQVDPGCDTGASTCATKIITTVVPTSTEDARDLGAMVTLLTRGMQQIDARDLRLVPAPDHSDSSCTRGDVSASGQYLYVCIFSNTWRRVAWSVGTW